jgi:hypothetical protein
MSVRPLAEADIPRVADLYWNYMRRGKGPAPPGLQPFLRELYFTNPFSDSAIPSLVYEDKNGKVVGFLGNVVRKLTMCGQPIKAVFGGNLVVHPDYRSGLAAPRLLSTMIATDHDLSLTDSANDISRKILERLGFRTIPALNLHWGRPLKPGRYAVFALTRGLPRLLAGGVKYASLPFCALADSMAAKASASPFKQKKPRLQGAPLDLETLFQCLTEFRKGYSVWPEYDLNSLGWLLSFMERRPSRGMLRKVVLRDESQQIVGWYIYYVKPGAVGEVVQVNGNPKFTKDILDHLFHDGWEHGLIGMHGVVDARRMADFSDKGCFFTCRGGWTVATSRKPELMKLLERGDAFISRLDGEWALDPGDS